MLYLLGSPRSRGGSASGLSIIGVLRKPLVGGGDQSDRSDRSDGSDGEDAGERRRGVLRRGEGVGTGGCGCKVCV